MKFLALKELAVEANVNWWRDLQSGELLQRNVAELIALQHSELDELWKGFRRDPMMPDEHIPEFQNALVEVADTQVRIADTVGGLVEYMGYPPQFVAQVSDWADTQYVVAEGTPLCELLLDAHDQLSDALDGFRKDNVAKMAVGFGSCFSICNAIGECFHEQDLTNVILAKMKFNEQRADHKIDNRKKDGGKKI